MVDVSGKDVTAREAVATWPRRGLGRGRRAAARRRRAQGRRARRRAGRRHHGRQATPDLVPLCHPIAISGVAVDLEVADDAVEITATVRTTDRTGVEMEALTAVSVAALALVDMVKAVDKAAVIDDIRVLRKSGGRSGDWLRRAGVVSDLAGRRTWSSVSNRAAAGVYEDTTGPRIVEALHGVGLWRRRRRSSCPTASRSARPSRRGVDERRRPGRHDRRHRTHADRPDPGDDPAVLDYEVPGIAEAIRAYGVGKGVATAALSRGIAGVAGRRSSSTCPGRSAGSRTVSRARAVLGHALDQIAGATIPAPTMAVRAEPRTGRCG